MKCWSMRFVGNASLSRSSQIIRINSCVRDICEHHASHSFSNWNEIHGEQLLKRNQRAPERQLIGAISQSPPPCQRFRPQPFRRFISMLARYTQWYSMDRVAKLQCITNSLWIDRKSDSWLADGEGKVWLRASSLPSSRFFFLIRSR